MKSNSSLTTAVLFGLAVAGVIVGSTLSIASAQSTTNGNITKALQAANQNNTMAAIGNKIIIVGACDRGVTDANLCTIYNIVPAGPPPPPAR